MLEFTDQASVATASVQQELRFISRMVVRLRWRKELPDTAVHEPHNYMTTPEIE